MTMKVLRPVGAALLLMASGCSGADKPAEGAATVAADARRVDRATSGRITGRVSFDGAPPANPRVRISGDPLCASANPEGMAVEKYVVTEGGLDNVFVHVKSGLAGYHFDIPAEPVRIDQQGCRYVPHVVGIQAGQPLEMTNSDATMHNVHAVPDVNGEFNVAQHTKDQRDTRTFTAPEVMVPLKCDLHPWMNAYVGVAAHPYFAVTTAGGKFELNNLPPGRYTIEAWHEKAGTQTQDITIGEKEAKDVTFTFRPATVG